MNLNDFFTLGSLTTLAGATTIVYFVCGAIQKAFNFSPKWLALVISMVTSLIGAYIGNSMADLSDPKVYLLAFINGVLIFMTATGTNQITSNSHTHVNAVTTPSTPLTPPTAGFAPPTNPAPRSNEGHKRSFNSNWWNN